MQALNRPREYRKIKMGEASRQLVATDENIRSKADYQYNKRAQRVFYDARRMARKMMMLSPVFAGRRNIGLLI